MTLVGQNHAKRQRQPARQTRGCRAAFHAGRTRRLEELIGFSVWERRGGGGRNVTFPARSYAVNGERPQLRAAATIADVGAPDAACATSCWRPTPSTRRDRQQSRRSRHLTVPGGCHCGGVRNDAF